MIPPRWTIPLALVPPAAVVLLGLVLPHSTAIIIGATVTAPAVATASWVAHRSILGSTTQAFAGLLGALLLRIVALACAMGALALFAEGVTARVWGMAAAGTAIAAGLALDAALLHAKVRRSTGKPPQ